MKSCYGYVRVSTQKQGDGVSLEAQREAILGFASRNDITITRWFEEKQTAAKGGRPVFSSMIRLLKQRQASGVVIHKIDRSARNFADWAKIGELSDVGIDVHFAAESLDFRSRGGRLSADIQAVIAADYIRNLREETLKGITGRLKQGLYPFKAPLGYLDQGGGKPKTVDPVRGPLIRELLEAYATGQHSIRSLIVLSKHSGLRNHHQKPLHKSGIEKIINNPFYAGIIRIETTGATYEGVHEPLISAATWQQIQDVKAGKCGKKVTRHNHTYRGLFRCQHCDTAMIPEKQKGFIYYRCHTPACATKCVREEQIERSVQFILTNVHLTDADIRRLTDEARTWIEQEETSNTSLNTTKLQLAELEARLDRLTDALIDRLIDEETFKERKERLLVERQTLREKLTSGDAQPTADDIREFLERIKSLAATYEMALPRQKRQILEWATSNRLVSERNVLVEPSPWLRATQEALSVYSGDPCRDTSRNHVRLLFARLRSCIKVANCDDNNQE